MIGNYLYNYIVNPLTEKVQIQGKVGQRILNIYLKYLNK